MKRATILSLMLVITILSYAQDGKPVDKVPRYFISTDLVYDIESIPTIGYERFFVKKDKLKSWRVTAAYQVHYSDQFGAVQSHGDKVSIGVYQGPVAKFGYSIYTRKHRKNWRNYFSPDIAIKYLWYDKTRVNTGRHITDLSYRIQSEQCVAVVPQFTIGAKHTNKHFCADFYLGLQLPVKFRDKTIYEEQNNQGIENPHVPYTSNITSVTIAPVFGIKLGYIK